MVINDLKASCPHCGGSGRQTGISEWGIPQINPDGRCRHCAGRGFSLTPLGRELVKLLRPFVLEMIEEQAAEQPVKPTDATGGDSA